MLMLVNPNEKKGSRTTKRLSPAQRRARALFTAAAKAGKLRKGVKLGSLSAQTNSRATSTRHKEDGQMAGKKKRRRRGGGRNTKGQFTRNARSKVTRRSAKSRHHKYGAFQYNRKRRHRRNPSIAPRGVVGSLMAAGRDALIITAAQVATNKVAGFIPGGTSPTMTAAKQVGVGLGLSLVARKVAPRWAHQVLVGALLAPVQTAVAKVVPIGMNGYGGGAGGSRNAFPGTGKYLNPPGVGSYVPWPTQAQPQGVGSYMAARKAAYY